MSNARQLNKFFNTTNRDVLLPSKTTQPSASNSIVDPRTNPAAWMYVWIENEIVPGWVVAMDGFSLKTGWDVKTGKGAKGASITLTNQPPSKGSITWYADPSQFGEWAGFLPKLKYQPDKNASTSAVSIYHPALSEVGVTSVVVEEIGIWLNRGRLRWERKIDFIVWTPPPVKNIVATPTKATEHSGPSARGLPPDPIGDAQQATIRQLMAIAQRPF